MAPELEVPQHILRPPYAAGYDHPPWTSDVEVHDEEVSTLLPSVFHSQQLCLWRCRCIRLHAAACGILSSTGADVEVPGFNSVHDGRGGMLNGSFAEQGIKRMRASCKLAAQVLQHAGTLVKVGGATPCHMHLIHSDALCSPDTLLIGNNALSAIHLSLDAALLLQPGVTTDEIDRAVHKMIIDNGAYPSPLRYGQSQAVP